MKNYLSEEFFDVTKQLIRKMKITCLLLLIFTSSLFATNVNSQVARVNISLKNGNILKVIKEIENQTDYLFVYNKNEVDLEQEVNVKVQNVTVAEVLTNIFDKTNIIYAMEGKNIMLMPKAVSQQQNILTGKVVDTGGEPLPGVSIVINGTTLGTVSDVNGYYTVSNVPEDAVLVFSFVGMRTQKIPVNGRTNINVTMEEEAIGLEEIVAVGYGTQKKVNVTGSVAAISGDELENRPLPNVGEVLRGVSPNLNIDLNEYGGEPGAKRDWNIRGTGSINGDDSPLILVDGVEMDINNLDPGNIESVSVLKDASASAIYGARAPFGVVLITTKKGKKNEAMRIQYNNNITFGTTLGIPHMENSLTYAYAYNQASLNAGSPVIYDDDYMERIVGYLDGTFPYEYDPENPPTTLWAGRRVGNANYDWPYEYMKDLKIDQRHNINLSGGSEKSQYYISLGYYDEDGFYVAGNDDYKRYDILSNFSSEVTDWLRFNLSIKYSNSLTDYPIGITTVERRYFFTSLYLFSPLTNKYNINGSLYAPMLRALQGSGRDKKITNDLLITIGTEIEPVKGWKTNVSYSYDNVAENRTANPKPVWVELGNGDFGNVGKPNTAYETSFSRSPYKLINLLTSYEKNFDDHFIKALVGYEQEEKFYTWAYLRAEDLITEEVPSISTALGETTIDDAKWDWATQGIFGRINYNYKEKFLLEVSARYNGSSRFEAGKRWGFFPSASAGYQISKENFWEPIKSYVNRLKIRASYGSLGNQSIGTVTYGTLGNQLVNSYLYIPSISIVSETPWIIAGDRPMYAATPDLVSGDLTWETITTLNLGLDAGFLRNRLEFTFDWFNRKTSDMVGPQVTLPYTLGADTPTANNAEMRTRGFELILTWKDKLSKDFSYNATLSLGDNKSTILKYKNDSGLIDTWYEGKEIGEIWGFISDGIMQTDEEVNAMPDQSAIYTRWNPGDIRYKDLDDDNAITYGAGTLDDHGDQVVIGNSLPRYNIGIGGGFNWKGIDFNMHWMGVLKCDYYPHTNLVTFWGLNNSWANSSILQGAPVLDYWRPADEDNTFGPNTDSYFAKPYFSTETNKNKVEQTRFLLNAAYLRLKNVQIGYTIPQNFSRKIFLEKARIYVSGDNLLTIKSLPKSIDPEQTLNSTYAVNGGFYPIARSFSVGLNLTF